MRTVHASCLAAVVGLGLAGCVPTGPVEVPTRSCSQERMADLRSAVDSLYRRGFIHAVVEDFVLRATGGPGLFCSRAQTDELYQYARDAAPRGVNPDESSTFSEIHYDIRTGREINYHNAREASRAWPDCFADGNPRDCRPLYDPWGGLVADDVDTLPPNQSCRLTAAWRRACVSGNPRECWSPGLAPFVMPVAMPAAGPRVGLAGAIRRATAPEPAQTSAPAPAPQQTVPTQRSQPRTQQVPYCREVGE